MHFLRFLAVFAVFSMVFPSLAQADPKPWIWSWGINHFDETDFSRRHMNDAKTPHNYQWENDWSPQGWIDERGSAEALLEDFYKMNIITGQYDEDDVPVLEVGQGWIDLSARERLRVLKFVDYMYAITETVPDGTILLYHHKTKKPIGVYTVHGLQLQ